MVRAGLCMFPTDKSIQPVPFARAAEERGFDTLYFPEHTHIPLSSKSPFLPEIPEHYKRSLDPFVALSAAAAATTRIKLATGICLIPQRDPITLAKEAASLDLISNGRFILGVGAGWNREEMENHGTPYAQRWALLRERIFAMREIWREETAVFHGKYVNFGPLWSYPKPVQPGGPPVWIGANSKYMAARVADYADGWMPIYGREGGATLDDLREACDRRGRDFSEISLALFFAPKEKQIVMEYIESGFLEMIFPIPSADEATVLREMDAAMAFMAGVRGL